VDGIWQAGITAMFERETKREKNLEARAKELRLKAKRAEGKTGGELELDDDADTITAIEKEFFDTLEKKKDVEEVNPLEVNLGGDAVEE
jgi:dynein intermediate chain 2